MRRARPPLGWERRGGPAGGRPDQAALAGAEPEGAVDAEDERAHVEAASATRAERHRARRRAPGGTAPCGRREVARQRRRQRVRQGHPHGARSGCGSTRSGRPGPQDEHGGRPGDLQPRRVDGQGHVDQYDQQQREGDPEEDREQPGGPEGGDDQRRGPPPRPRPPGRYGIIALGAPGPARWPRPRRARRRGWRPPAPPRWQARAVAKGGPGDGLHLVGRDELPAAQPCPGLGGVEEHRRAAGDTPSDRDGDSRVARARLTT